MLDYMSVGNRKIHHIIVLIISICIALTIYGMSDLDSAYAKYGAIACNKKYSTLPDEKPEYSIKDTAPLRNDAVAKWTQPIRVSLADNSGNDISKTSFIGKMISDYIEYIYQILAL